MDQRDRTYFNMSVEDFQPKRDPLYIVLPMTFLYTCIFVTGVVGNISTCIVISRNKHMHTATNYYLFSLAISDLLLLVSGLPQEMYLIWSRYPYVFGEPFCLLRGLAAETSANATVLTITAFTVERYVAICHPFLAHTISKLSRAVKFIIAIWIIALASAIPQALQFGLVSDATGDVHCGLKRILIAHAFELSTFLFFVLPMTLITVLYALIGLRLRKSSVVSRESGGSFGHTEVGRKGAPPHRHHCSRRVLKMLVAVVVAFFICWAPFHAQRLFYIYYNVQPIPPTVEHIYAIVTYISGILYYLSTTINPILYHIMSLKFREAFKTTVAKCCFNERRTRPYLTLSRGKTEPDSGKSGTDTAVATNQEDQVYIRSCPHDISNSSLRRLEEGGLEDELTSYMKELERRQTS